MTSTTETGHAKNVANFEDLISFCTGYGTACNPSKNNLKLTALNTLFTNSKSVLQTVKSQKHLKTMLVMLVKLHLHRLKSYVPEL